MSTFKKYMSIIQEEKNDPFYMKFMTIDFSKNTYNDEGFLKALEKAIKELSNNDNNKDKLNSVYDFIFNNLKTISLSENPEKATKAFKEKILEKQEERSKGINVAEKTTNEFIFQFLEQTLKYLENKNKQSK